MRGGGRTAAYIWDEHVARVEEQLSQTSVTIHLMTHK